MPWAPELFSAPQLERLKETRRQQQFETVLYFDGLLAGEPDALIDSFTGVPELHDPVRGRVKGTGSLEEFASETRTWLEQRNATIEPVGHFVGDRHGFEETVLHLDGQGGRVELPVAIVGDRSDGRLDELRVYYSGWPLSGRHTNRPPLLQPDPESHESDFVAEYRRALAAGDVDAIVATFETDGYAREPAGDRYVHRGPEGLRSFYEALFSNGGGIPLECCSVIGLGGERSCVLEYNLVRWGKTELPPEAGVAVFEWGESGKLAAVRSYDDAEPPSGAAT